LLYAFLVGPYAFLVEPYVFFRPYDFDAYSPHTGPFSYGFPWKLRAGPYGSYDNCSYAHNLRSCEIKAWKKFRPERDSNPFIKHRHARRARVIFLCEVSEMPSYFLTGNLIPSLMQPALWVVWHAHMHNSLTQRTHNPSNPQEEFLLKNTQVNLETFSHFIRVVHCKFTFLHNTTQHNFTENRKRKKPLTRWKSDLIKLYFNLVPRSLQRTFEQFSYFLPLKISDWNECHQIKLLNCYCRDVKTVQRWKLFFV